MLRLDHQFALELLTTEGKSLGQSRLEPDFGPAVQAARFQLARQRLPDFGRLAVAEPQVQPVFASPGSPLLDGFKIELSHAGERLGEASFPRTVFARAARAAAADLVQRGVLKEGEQYLYRAAAFARTDEPAADATRPAFGVEVRTEPPAWQPGDFAALEAASEPFGEQHAGELPVWLPAQVLEEAGEIATQTGTNETGGILCGHLHHDAARNDLGVVVTAQLPAPHTEAKSDALTFTPASWAAVRAALALRRRGEIILGWWHSHGGTRHWCAAQCGPERRRDCAWGRSFFSEQDLLFQQTVFAQPFHVALVVTQLFESPPRFALYGWRDALVAQRGFRLLNAPASPQLLASPQPNGGTPHETKPCT